MRRTSLPLFLTSLVPAALLASFAHANPWASAAQEGDDLSGVLELLVEDTGVPGLVGLALLEGQPVAWGAAGVRRYGSPDPIQLSDPIHLGSCTKAMASALVARLIEAGHLSWETTLAEVLPELAAEVDPGYSNVTVRQLLQHRGGIAERRRPEIFSFTFLQELEGTPAEVRLALLREVLKTGPVEPEDGYDYSNIGYMAAGAMVERLLGKPWEELIQMHVFDPLGMASAGVGSPSGAEAAVGHQETRQVWNALPAGPAGVLPESMGPAGLAHTNLMDWGRFVVDQVSGAKGEGGFLQPENYKALQANPAGSTYACGWACTEHVWSDGRSPVLTHNGSDGTWFSEVYALTEPNIVILTATNCGTEAAQSATSQVRALMLETLGYAEVEDATPPNPIQSELQAIAARARAFSAAYVAGNTDAQMEIYAEDAVIAPPGSPFLSDRAAIRAYWTLPEGRRILAHETTAVKVEIDGRLAYDWGTYSGTSQQGERTRSFRGKYLIVWRKDEDGAWRMVQDMWNPLPESARGQ